MKGSLMMNRPQRLQVAVRSAVNQFSRSVTRRTDTVISSAAPAVTGSDYAHLAGVLHAGFTRSVQHRNDEYLREHLWTVTAGLPEPLMLALSRYLAAPEAPGSPLALRAVPAAVAADVALLPIWSPTSGTGAPFPEQLRRLPAEVDADLAVDFDVYSCDDCTLTDTPASDTHWLIEVATIWAPGDLTAAQQAALVTAAATCGAEVDEGAVMYVGAGRDCPPGCSAHQSHRGDCRPQGVQQETGLAMSTDFTFLHDRVEDAVRAAVTVRLGQNAYQDDQLSAWALQNFPPTLLAALHPLIDPAGMNRGPGNRPWFNVTLPMQTAARIIANWHWAPELDIVDRDPRDKDLSGYYTVPSSMAAHWLLSSTPTRDQQWTMRLRFTDLTGQDRSSGVSPYAQSSTNPARSTGAWTVGIDWIAVDVAPRSDVDFRELRHQARDQMLAALNWPAFSQDHPGVAPGELWRECGVIDFHDSVYSTGPKSGDVCDCGLRIGMGATA